MPLANTEKKDKLRNPTLQQAIQYIPWPLLQKSTLLKKLRLKYVSVCTIGNLLDIYKLFNSINY